MAAVRLLILVPLGILFGACAATMALFVLAATVPEFSQTFGAALVAAFNALLSAGMKQDDGAAVLAVGGRIWSLTMLVLLAPVALTAVISEVARMRGALLHMVLAGALTILLPFASVAPSRAPTPGEGRVLACLFFTGAAAGLIYWLIAGRRREKNPPALVDREAGRKIVS